MPHEIKPTTISRHAFGVYPSIAMLAGMQLDVFTPLKDGLTSGFDPKETLRAANYCIARAQHSCSLDHLVGE
jgi:hypothetical protein